MKKTILFRVVFVLVALIALSCLPQSALAQRGGHGGGGGGFHGGGGGGFHGGGAAAFHGGGGFSGGSRSAYVGGRSYGGYRGGYYGGLGNWLWVAILGLGRMGIPVLLQPLLLRARPLLFLPVLRSFGQFGS